MMATSVRSKVMEGLIKLRLTGMKEAYDDVIATAVKNSYSTERTLVALLDTEAQYRELKTIQYRLSSANFPASKDLSTFDFGLNNISRTRIEEFCNGDFLGENTNIILIGSAGTGKTHLALAIGSSLARMKKRVKFFNLIDLANMLEKEALDSKVGQTAKLLQRQDCVILDELGYNPMSRNSSHLLFHTISKLYETTSIIITTNLHFSEWVNVFKDERMTQALLDRIAHHCEVVETGSTSWRLLQRKKRNESGNRNKGR